MFTSLAPMIYWISQDGQLESAIHRAPGPPIQVNPDSHSADERRGGVANGSWRRAAPTKIKKPSIVWKKAESENHARKLFNPFEGDPLSKGPDHRGDEIAIPGAELFAKRKAC
jgi:hypothetical protein